MMLADVFRASEFGREDFTTNSSDTPLVIQFAANNYKDFSEAAELVAPYTDGLDLNCGCPQKWAIKDGYGSYLLNKPELVADMVKAVKNRVNIPCSIKIRIYDNDSDTVELVRRAIAANVDWITVHGRTKKQSSNEPVNMDTIKLVKQISSVPIIANGGIFSYSDAQNLYNYTGVNGVMSARGLLENPALFSIHKTTPLDCIKDYVNLAVKYGTNHFIFHHHLMYMFEGIMSSSEKKTFNSLTSISMILDHLYQYYNIECY
ncbi:tRNA-dihydrouridine(20a/20b) synthase [NAD(P)+]-like [Smittium culicis]|uniref:tRNA-dihydrouridine(20a/20b) synthase [NAD(P)+]-like n=1 Tax=Smittium culicis TaxID=133412 RepID=A0A1R1XM05_9FUNG|nr:tRNA-dihydrouridine(20a/20b) synthase [NAD(P)+]-like [Smittium culicis]